MNRTSQLFVSFVRKNDDGMLFARLLCKHMVIKKTKQRNSKVVACTGECHITVEKMEQPCELP